MSPEPIPKPDPLVTPGKSPKDPEGDSLPVGEDLAAPPPGSDQSDDDEDDRRGRKI